MIRAIFACDEDFGIGKNGTLPWPKNTEDLHWFKTLTTNNIVVMGRRTWNDPFMPKPLPSRYNIVVTSDSILEGPNITIKPTDNVEKLLKSFEKDVWVIGGATLFKQTLDMCEEILVSRISGVYNCDTFVTIPHTFKLTNVEHKTALTIETYTKQ